MDDKLQKELFRKRLEEQINKVPEHVQNGSVQTTREWMKRREAAVKVLKKPGSTVAQLMAAISSIE